MSARRGRLSRASSAGRPAGARRRVARQALVGAFLCLLAPVRAFAHPTVPTVVLVEVKREDGAARVHAIITHDALAYALNDTSARVTDPQMYELLKTPEAELAATLRDGRERFAAAFGILADGNPVATTLVVSPTVEGIDEWKADNPSLRLPCKLEFVVDATLPAGTTDLTVHMPYILGDGILTVKRPGVEPVYVPMLSGADSPAFDVRMATARPAPPAEHVERPTGVGASEGSTSRDSTGRASTEGAPKSGPKAADSKAAETAEPRPTRSLGVLRVGLRYVRLGYTHIMPEGWDHALFVLGLFLLSPRLKDVVWMVTTFTIAHTITLTLATLHIVTIRASIVEPTIAATIAFIAIENLLATKVHLWRPAVAFVFGLVHGLGFATALMDVGLPPGQLAVGIVSFSVGVELGHITVVLAAFALLGWARNKPWYRHRVSMPLSVCIAAVSLFWLVQRIM